jgi:hypothetical protein
LLLFSLLFCSLPLPVRAVRAIPASEVVVRTGADSVVVALVGVDLAVGAAALMDSVGVALVAVGQGEIGENLL